MEQNKYQRGIIYAIRSHHTDDVYLGSTTQPLHKRLHQHKCHKLDSVNEILKYGDAYIDLVENFPCNSKAELNKREGWYIRNSDCVNKRIAGRTQQEYDFDNKEIFAEKAKIYYAENKESILEKSKAYYEANKEKKSEKSKNYYVENKESCLEKCKAYREANKEKRNERERIRYEANKESILEKQRTKYAQSKSGSVALE